MRTTMTSGNGRTRKKTPAQIEAARVALARKKKLARERARRNA